jgi:hypothetical protein
MPVGLSKTIADHRHWALALLPFRVIGLQPFYMFNIADDGRPD